MIAKGCVLGEMLPPLGAMLLIAGCLPDGAAAPDAAVDGPANGARCDDSPPSQIVDRDVWAESFMFFFTPAGAEIKTLYVPANSLVRLRLSNTLNEEAHIFQITAPGVPGCATPEIMMGAPGAAVSYAWKAPTVPGTYAQGGICVNHAGMDFAIVVTD